MRLKNVNFIERHVEKFILFLAALFFMAVVWVYSLGQPYAVTIGTESGVSPDQIERRVLAVEAQLRAKIEPGSTSPLPHMTVPTYTDMFRRRIDRPLVSTAELDPLGPPGLASINGSSGLGEGGQWHVPEPPAPVRVQARSGFGVLLDAESLVDHFATQLAQRPSPQKLDGDQIIEAYGQLVGSDVPRDFRYVSVGGLFDVGAWRKNRIDSGGIPHDWWESAMVLTDVLLERQTFDATVGNWGGQAVIAALPGALSLRDVPDRWSKKQAQEMIRLIRSRQDEIARVPFAPMPVGISWTAPIAGGIGAMSEADYATFLRLTQDIKILEDQLYQLEDPIRVFRPRRSEQTSRTNTTSNRIQQSGRRSSVPNETSQGLQQQLEEKRSLLEALQEQSSNGAALRGWEIWGHDVTVEPGKTYRYRLRVSLVNPLFQRQMSDGPLRQQFFDSLSVDSHPSAWSAPITVEPNFRFFVVGGSGIEREATIEVWRVVHGRQHVREFRVRPGDSLGGVVSVDVHGQAIPVDMSIEALVVDLVDTQLGTDIDSRSTLLFVDMKTDTLQIRTIEIDRNSPNRARLLREVTSQTVPRSGDEF